MYSGHGHAIPKTATHRHATASSARTVPSLLWFGLVALILLSMALIRISMDTSFRLSTLTHLPIETWSIAGDTALQSQTLIPKRPTILRYDWTTLERLGPLARRFELHQADCSKPYVKFQHRPSGLGSNLHIYSAHLCRTVQDGQYRFKSILPWVWLDETTCAAAAISNVTVDEYQLGHSISTSADSVKRRSTLSSMACYFPGAEPTCRRDLQLTVEQDERIATKLHFVDDHACNDLARAYGGTSAIRAAATEFVFTRVSNLIQDEAERQLRTVFQSSSNNGTAVPPPNLITVHMRWGDKGSEMKLQSADVYVQAVHTLLDQRRNRTHDVRYWNDSYSGVNIYLATEDPKALVAFRKAAPSHWNVHVDDFFPDAGAQNMVDMAQQSSRAGWITLALLLVSMEANTFVLTTASNWSRLMNELRKNVLDPRCNNCTLMIDLLEDEW